MRSFGRSCLCLVAAALADPTALPAQDKTQDAFVQRFLDALAERQKSVRAARFELSGKVLYTALGSQNPEAPEYFYPAQDVTGEFSESVVLDFERNRFRQDYSGFQMYGTDKGGQPATVRRIHTFDGVDMYTVQPRTDQNSFLYRDAPPDSAEATKWDVQKGKSKMPAFVFFFASYPMLYSCGRLPQPLTNYRIDARPQYQVSDFQLRGVVPIGSIRCAVLRWVRPPVKKDYVEWCVDLQDPARIVRFQRVSDGQRNYEVESQFPPGSRVPSSWVMRDYGNPNPKRANRLSKETQYKVESAEFDATVTDADFSPDFRPGMRVRTPEGVLSVARDGETLARPGGFWRNWKAVLIGLVGVGALLVFLVRIVRLRRRRATGAA